MAARVNPLTRPESAVIDEDRLRRLRDLGREWAQADLANDRRTMAMVVRFVKEIDPTPGEAVFFAQEVCSVLPDHHRASSSLTVLANRLLWENDTR